MGAQALFNHVATHLLTQKKKSKSLQKDSCGREIYACAYHGEGGLSCAVGCLIPDDLYTPSMEGKLYNFLPEVFLEYMDEKYGANNNILIARLQNVHDAIQETNWHAALLEVAIENHLVMPEIETSLDTRA